MVMNVVKTWKSRFCCMDISKGLRVKLQCTYHRESVCEECEGNGGEKHNDKDHLGKQLARRPPFEMHFKHTHSVLVPESPIRS